MKRGWILLLLCMAAASCATLSPPAPGTTSSPMPGRDPVPAPSSSAGRTGGSASPMPGAPHAASSSTAHVPAVVDSQPSREALEVLNTIPEPLGAGERVAAPSKDLLAADTSAAEDSTVADSSAGGTQVPTPAPTQALGDRPGSLTPSSSASPSPPPSSTPAKAAAPAAAAASKSVNPDSCWRVQVGAPPEVDKANALRSAAQSQLQVPVVIEVEGGLRKVRTRECVDMATADVLRRRALAAGFEGAFKVKGPAK